MSFSLKNHIDTNPVTIIAEIGSSHQGNLDHAKRLMEAAKKSGAHCVKFQAIFADEIVHTKVGKVLLPTGNVPLYDTFKALEKSQEFYQKLKEESSKLQLDFLCTPFGLKSFTLLENLNVSAYKVASPELNHLPLLDAISRTGKPVLLSLGVSKLSHIECALEHITNAQNRVTLLNCVTCYPAKEEDYNLNLLPHLAAIFGVKVGISDHSLDPILIPALSVYRQASIIEKHICLSRKGIGLDDPIALEPSQFKSMVEAVHQAQYNPQYLNTLIAEYGKEKIAAIFGDGIKKLAPSERKNYGYSNRSLCAVHDIKAEEFITLENTALYRSEKQLSPGLHPKFLSLILEKKVIQFIPAGEGIQWNNLF